MSRGILRDVREMCEPFRRDFVAGRIREWLDFPSPGGRARKLDLVVAEPGGEASGPDLGRLRLCVENKSVVTAHRNRTNRYDDLSDVPGVLHQKKPDAILIATVLVGVAESVLNTMASGESGNSRSEVAREALRRQLRLVQFELLRKKTMPFAEARGYLTDEDVFSEIS